MGSTPMELLKSVILGVPKLRRSNLTHTVGRTERESQHVAGNKSVCVRVCVIVCVRWGS